MPARVIRAMYPKSTATSAKAGSSRCWTCVAAFAPGGHVAPTGNQPSSMPRITISTIAVVATQTGYLIGGLLVIEKLFNYNGIGQRIYVAAQNKDYPMLQSGVMIVGIVFLVATLIADILYSVLNPRIRYGGAE